MVENIINMTTTIDKYKDKNRLLREAIPYTGQPKQSLSEPDKIFLRQDPLSSHSTMLEFKAQDIVFAENIETVADHNGETFQIFKIWVKLGSIGVKLEPFTV